MPAAPSPIPGEEIESTNTPTRQKFLDKLRKGELEHKEIEIDMTANIGVEIMAPPGMEEMTDQLQGMFENTFTTTRTCE